MEETYPEPTGGSIRETPPLRYLYTLAIGLGFGTTAITWTFYNGNMIGFIERNFQPRYAWMTSAFIGFIMTWDNIIAMFVQPYIGTKSDNTRTRWGKRMPYIMVGVPLAAIFFTLIPLTATEPLWMLIIVVLAFNMSMAIYRSPVVALMPDLTPKAHHSKANGLINLVGGLFAGVALLVGGSLVENYGFFTGFLTMSIIMVVTFIIFFMLVKEPDIPAEEVEDKPPVSLKKEIKLLFEPSHRSKLFILLGISSWFMAWNALEVWLPPYIAVNILGETDPTLPSYETAIGIANKAIFLVPIIFVLMTLPGGFLGERYGQKRIIGLGLLIFIGAMTFGIFQTELSMVSLSFIVAAIGWAFINVNSIVIVWGLSKENIGAGTGLYYLASSVAAILGPISFGFLRDVTGTLYGIWFFSLFWLALAVLLILGVKYDHDGEMEMPVLMDD